MQIIETNLKFRSQPIKRSRTNYIVLHHADASRCTVYDVHQWHLNKDWIGIGYHFFVDKTGRVYRGRPIDTIGAHCPGYNANSVAICCEGNYEQEHMPPAQWKAILELVDYLKQVYPGVKVVGHRDLYSTACPGRYFPLGEIKAGRGPADVAREVIAGMFKDVPNGHWAKGSIERLAKLGLIKGDEKGNFRPDQPITRAEVAVLLDRVLKLIGK